jgi:hypothetical protein
MRTLDVKPFIILVLTLAWNIAQADPAFTFTHIGGGETGSLTKNAEGNYTFIGGGNDIWDVSDEFDFAQTQVTGDFDVAVRVESLEFTATWTKAGIMVREELTGSSRMAFNRVTPDDSQLPAGLDGANDTRFSYRTGRTGGAGSNDGQHEEGSGSPNYPNGWLRLQREGTMVRGYASTDGVNWRLQGEQNTATWLNNVALPSTVYLGLAVSRHSGGDPLATCEFRDLQAPKISSQPASLTVPEASPASFKIGLAGWADWRVQWRENGVDISGQTGRTLSFAAVAPGQNGKRYSAVATDVFSGQVLTSADAVLTVISDTFPATLVSAATPISPAPSGTQFDLLYSEPVNKADAENLANYSISAGATLLSATLLADNKTVHFTCSDLYGPGCKVLTVNNVRDRAPTPNPIAANSQIGIVTAKGSIRYHRYDNIGGSLTDLMNSPKFPNFPDIVAYPTLLENPGGGGEHADNYGAQLVGFLHPPVTGPYKFFVSADDASVVYLSTDESPANKVAIAREPDWAGFRNFIDQGPEDRDGNAGNGAETINANRGAPGAGMNISAPLTLQAGCKYYVEVLHKEGTGGDYTSVAWQYPGSPVIANGSLPITGAFLSPYDIPATIGAGLPLDVSTAQNRIVTFSANISGSPTLLIQWYRNDEPITGATTPSLTYGPVKYPDDNGARFYVVAQNVLNSVTSRVATLTVSSDTEPPVCVSATASFGLASVLVRFDELVDPNAAGDSFNYELPGRTIQAVTVNPDGMSVTVAVDPPFDIDSGYSITMSGISDIGGNVRTSCTLNFHTAVISPGFALQRLYQGIGGNTVGDLTASPKYPNSPDSETHVGLLEGPINAFEAYGTSLSGWLLPPVSGNYNFFMSTDDGGEFWLSTDSSPVNLVRIANEPSWNGVRDWLGTARRTAAAPENRSTTLFPGGIPLVAGQRYAFHLLSKEGGGGDNCAVAWQLPGDPPPLNGSSPIRGTYMAALADPAGKSLTISQQPADTSVCIIPGSPNPASAQFSLGVNVTPAGATPYIQWQRNNGSGWFDVPGATGNSYSFIPNRIDNGARFRAAAYLAGLSAPVMSGEATLTVIQANTPPAFNLAATVNGTEDAGAQTIPGVASDIQPHSIVRTPVAFATSFDSAAGLNLGGVVTTATVQDGVLKLTTPVNSASGWAGVTAPLQNYESLDISWKSLVGGGADGADGYSLSIGDDVPASPGYGGEEGIGTGLIVAVDTFDNGGLEDGIQIKWHGGEVAFHHIPKNDDGTGVYLRKNAFVNAHLTVSASGAATFEYDGTSISADLGTPIFPYVGVRANRALFWARTGGANDNHWIDDLDIKAFPFDASSAEAGQQVSFQASNNNPGLFSSQPAISPNGTLTFTAAPNACGQATVSVVASDNGGTACNGNNTSAAKTLVINIACVNDCPVATPRSLTAGGCGPVPVPLGGTDPDGDSLTAAAASNPSHGTLSVSGGQLVYTANAGYTGPDSFTFTVSDGTCTSAPATVSINVTSGSPPVCVAGIAPAGCGLSIGNDGKKYAVSLNGSNACVVLNGSASSDPDGQALTITWLVDGNLRSGATVPVCLEVGCHTVTMTVSDGSCSCSTSFELCVVTPGEAIEQLVGLVEGTDLDRKNKRPLIATLKAAGASYDRGDHDHTAANQLNAFQNKVRAQIGKSDPAAAQKFIDAAAGLVEAIDCATELAEALEGN